MYPQMAKSPGFGRAPAGHVIEPVTARLPSARSRSSSRPVLTVELLPCSRSLLSQHKSYHEKLMIVSVFVRLRDKANHNIQKM